LPTDSWIDYTLEHTLAALEPQWSADYQSGKLVVDVKAKKVFDAYIARTAPSALARAHIKKLSNPETSSSSRDKAYAALDKMHGDAKNGRSVFSRLCVSCHKVGDTGYTFGPDMSDVGKRLSRRDLFESIIEPSKKVDPKFVTTTIITNDGTSKVGFIIKKDQESVTLLMAEGKQATIATEDIDEMAATNQSSMPENLASTLSPAEFLDVIEFLSSRK
jgi:putative heme-binding domain-containing protein